MTDLIYIAFAAYPLLILILICKTTNSVRKRISCEDTLLHLINATTALALLLMIAFMMLSAFDSKKDQGYNEQFILRDAYNIAFSLASIFMVYKWIYFINNSICIATNCQISSKVLKFWMISGALVFMIVAFTISIIDWTVGSLNKFHFLFFSISYLSIGFLTLFYGCKLLKLLRSKFVKFYLIVKK